MPLTATRRLETLRLTRVVDQPPALPPLDSQAGWTSSLESTAVMMTQPCTCAPELGADELRYLQLLSNGHPVSDIARMTGARESDIEALLESAQTKLGARNRLQALLAATRLGLFPLA